MKRLIFAAVLVSGPMSSTASARSSSKAQRLVEDALGEAEDDRRCRRAVGDDLSIVLEDLEDGRRGSSVAKQLDRILGDAEEDCPRGVVRSIEKALRLLEDTSDNEAYDERDTRPKRRRKIGPAEKATAQCEAKKGAACYDLALMYEHGRHGLEADDSRAAELYELSCSLRSMKGCYAMGNVYKNGFGGVESDDARAFKHYQRACNGGHAEACFQQGYLTETGRGTAVRPKQALKLYQKSCGKKSGEGCNAIGNAHKNGFAHWPVNLSKAASSYEASCKLKFGLGCFNLARAYQEGEGVRRSPKNANGYYAVACQHGHAEACKLVDHGKLLKDGVKDVTKALESFQNANFGSW